MPVRLGRLEVALAAAATLAGTAPSALAQVALSGVTGVVHDQKGAVVPGATVTLVSPSTGQLRVALTTRDGIYTVPGVPSGEYQLGVALAGFRTFHRLGLRLSTGETLRLDVTLTLGDLHEDVTVTGAAPAVRLETASLGTVVDHQEVVGLPLNGRTFIGLAALAPGVALPLNSQLPRINGGRPRTNEYLFDGISVLQPEPGQVAFVPVVDAIQEFKIERNSPPAEFGRFNGGVINLTTRSGGNVPHGSAFDFVRHERLNARNVFQAGDPVRPRYRRQQFGGTLGGPIARNRTFFFGDYQGTRQSIGRTVISTVPTLLQREGIFTEATAGRVPVIYDPATTNGSLRVPFPGQMIPSARIDPVAAALIGRYPLPTSPGTSNNYRRTGPETTDEDQWDVRLDHRLPAARDQIFGRVSSFTSEVTPVTPLPDGSGATPGTLGPQHTTALAFASRYQRTLSDRALNEVRAGETRRRVRRTAAVLAAPAASVLHFSTLPSDSVFADTLPTFLIGGYQQLGSPPNAASRFETGVTELADTFTWLRGHHTLKAGADLRWERLDVLQPPSPTGSFSFNALGSDLPGVPNTGSPLASFLLGQVQAFSIDLQRKTIQERAHVQEYFVQDDWKVSERLTINPGLRYTLNFPSTEINGQTAVFNLATAALEYPGTRPVRELKKNNLGPRFGAVYRLDDRTILSSAYGLVWIEMAGITTPFTTPSFPFLQTFTERNLDSTTPAFLLRDGPRVEPLAATPTAGLGQGVFAVDRTLGSGYVQQWNVSVQRELVPGTTFEAAYTGSHITRVGIPDSNLNQLTVDQLALGESLLQRVPNPYFGVIPRSSSLGDPTIPRGQLMKPYPAYTTVSLYRNNVGTTQYHGLEVEIRRRFTRRLSYSVAYTRSRLTDTASSVFDASVLTGPVANAPIADSHDLSRERDYSTGDIPHVLAASLVWEVPPRGGRRRGPSGLVQTLVSDWTMAIVARAQSGTPVAVTQVTNFNAFAGFGVQRPNLVGDPELPAGQRSATRWFDTAAFSEAPRFTLGSASRNPVRGPSFRNVDLTLIRRVPVRTGSVELRVDAFDLLNTAALGAPAAVFGAADFGSITSAGDPRVIQLSAKWLF